ncbi:MAG TPA: hypothetical protein PLL53_08455 [Saprospiraceae bacterium]|nr:hypothetical protein [Saprospiraceae bacterium]
MQPLTIRRFFGIFFGFILLSCCGHSKKTIVSFEEKTVDKCFLIQEFVELGQETFEPYLEEYSSFINESNRFDLLIRVLGQNSKLIRITNINNNGDGGNQLKIKTLIGDSESEKQVSFDYEELIKNIDVSSKLYHCNTSSSDLGTEIYLLKIDKELVLKIWVENGNYRHLREYSKKCVTG